MRRHLMRRHRRAPRLTTMAIPPPFDALYVQARDIGVSIVAAGLLMVAVDRPTRWASECVVPLLPLPFRAPAVIACIVMRLVVPVGAAVWLYAVLPGWPS